jgi:excisionase family DNA binding protein
MERSGGDRRAARAAGDPGPPAAPRGQGWRKIKIAKKPDPASQSIESADPRRLLKLLSVREAAVYAKVSKKTGQHLIKGGKLQATAGVGRSGSTKPT